MMKSKIALGGTKGKAMKRINKIITLIMAKQVEVLLLDVRTGSRDKQKEKVSQTRIKK